MTRRHYRPSGVGDHSRRLLYQPRTHPGAHRRRSHPRLRDIAASVGITERAAATIVNDLVEAGYLTRTRIGRRTKNDVHDELPLRHPLHRHNTVGELIRSLEGPATDSRYVGKPERIRPRCSNSGRPEG